MTQFQTRHGLTDTRIHRSWMSMGGSSNSSHGYRHEMSDDDHRALAECLRNCRSMVVLSGYANSLYLDVLDGWRMVSTEARISAARGTALRTECLWLNPACLVGLDRGSIFGKAIA